MNTCTSTLAALTLTFAIVFGIFSLMTSLAKHDAEVLKENRHLPPEAHDVVDVGNNWQEFTYKNERFLSRIDGRHACVVRINYNAVGPEQGPQTVDNLEEK